MLPEVGQVCVVTGASGGVGRAIALRLAVEEGTLCLIGRRREALETVAREVQGLAAHALVYPADLTRDDDLSDLIGRLRADVARVDVLVHAAGAIALGPVEEAPVADFDRQYATNVRAAYVLTQGLLPRLKASHGQVVFVNSSAGLTGRRGSSQYAATKHALHALADSLREEVNDDGVRVLSVFLGRTATPMQMAVHQAENRRFDPDRLIQAQDVGRIVSEVLRLPRSVEVTEMTLRPMEKPRA